jgi:hemoglobin-like flavoprotein
VIRNPADILYQTMLAAHPELKNVFSMSGQASGEQQKALAGSLVAYSAHIEDLAPLVGVVQRIAAKHAALGVKPQHYPIVGEHLIGAIVHVLGEAFTPELQDAWYHVREDMFLLSILFCSGPRCTLLMWSYRRHTGTSLAYSSSSSPRSELPHHGPDSPLSGSPRKSRKARRSPASTSSRRTRSCSRCDHTSLDSTSL